MLQVVSADDTTTTSTSSSTVSRVEIPTHSTMDAEVMSTSFELGSISDITAHIATW